MILLRAFANAHLTARAGLKVENHQSTADAGAGLEHPPRSTVFLMYHELELPGRELCRSGPGYARYVISKSDFKDQVALLADRGFHGLNVSQASARSSSARGEAQPPARTEPPSRITPGASPPIVDSRVSTGPEVVFTFDDGCETDLLVAAGLLGERGFGATFFLVAAWVGSRGYLSREQARALAAMKAEPGGFELGCHSMTHARLSHLSTAALRTEIVDAKDRLEQITGEPVIHFSCPGGSWSPEVARVAREAGYRSVSTSRIGTHTPRSDPYRLNRVAVLRGCRNFLQVCRGHGVGRLRLEQIARSAVRSAVGESAYDRMRGVLLR